MIVTLTNTSKIVEINGVPARIWEGTTESGVPVHAYITRIAHRIDETPDKVTEFNKELKQVAEPSEAVKGISLRQII
jgi:hypothetical protein